MGGYGCGFAKPNDDPYMQELIVRWYQFGLTPNPSPNSSPNPNPNPKP